MTEDISIPNGDHTITTRRDFMEEEIDTLADLCAFWKKNKKRGYTSKAIRAAIILTSEEIVRIKKNNDPGSL